MLPLKPTNQMNYDEVDEVSEETFEFFLGF